MPLCKTTLCLLLALCVLRIQVLAEEPPGIPGSPAIMSERERAAALEHEDAKPETAEGLFAVLVGTNCARMLKGQRIQPADTKMNTNDFSGVARSYLLAPMLQSSANQYSFNLALHSHSFIGQTVVGAADTNAMGLIAMLTRRKITTTYVWAVRGSTSLLAVPDDPTFEVHYGDLPGINSSEFQPAIVKLTATSNNWRRLGVMRAKIDASAQSAQSAQLFPFIEERMAAKVTALEKGAARISPTHLPPGEYALVLRFVSRSAKVAVSDIGSDHGNWLVLGEAWAFTVK